MPVPIEEASRFGIMVTDDIGRITEFEEKPEHPSSNLASMGIYIFSWPALKEALMSLKDQNSCDFGKHVLPYCKEKGERLFAYEYNGYWKDVGTLGSYWEANMELIDIIPEFNLYEEFWKIYTKGDIIPPQYISADAVTDRCLIGEGAEIYGEIHNSVIGPNKNPVFLHPSSIHCIRRRKVFHLSPCSMEEHVCQNHSCSDPSETSVLPLKQAVLVSW